MSGSLQFIPARKPIPFRAVNRRGSAQYDASLQRHHLLPRQLLSVRAVAEFLRVVQRAGIRFDDFRTNGLLLPANEKATLRTGLPLHRGPHRDYNRVVIARVGRIEGSWSSRKAQDPYAAIAEAILRMRLLQSALRRRLLDERRRMILNRKDPLGSGFDFSTLDRMAERLWSATEPR